MDALFRFVWRLVRAHVFELTVAVWLVIYFVMVATGTDGGAR